MTIKIYLTVKQFIEKHLVFSNGSLRALIFNSEKNGLAKSGAIVRIGRKILISEEKFFCWIDEQNGGSL